MPLFLCYLLGGKCIWLVGINYKFDDWITSLPFFNSLTKTRQASRHHQPNTFPTEGRQACGVERPIEYIPPPYCKLCLK